MKHLTSRQLLPVSAKTVAMVAMLSSLGGIATATQVVVSPTGPQSNQSMTIVNNQLQEQRTVNSIGITSETTNSSRTGQSNTMRNSNAEAGSGTGITATTSATTTNIVVAAQAPSSETTPGGRGAGGNAVSAAGGATSAVSNNVSSNKEISGGKGGGEIAVASASLPEVGASQPINFVAMHNLSAPFAGASAMPRPAGLDSFFLPMSVISLLAGCSAWLLQRRSLFGKA